MTLSRLPGAAEAQFAKIKRRKLEEEERKRLEAAANAERVMLDDVVFQRGRLLGAGTFGKVYEALNVSTGKIIAVKVIELKSQKAQEVAKAAKQEIELMQKLTHPNIVQVLGSSLDTNALNVYLEFVAGNSLDSIVQQVGALHEAVIRRYVKQMLYAIEYCHSKGIVHRDIKGKNILLGSDGQVKIGDWGSAKAIEAEQDGVTQTYSYTPLFVAPEVMSGNYTNKVDVWSLGCVVIELASGAEPWSEHNFDSSFAALYYIASNPTAMPLIPASLSPAGQDFIRLCLTRNVEHRPSATQLLQHPFVQQSIDVSSSSFVSSATSTPMKETMIAPSKENDVLAPAVFGCSSTVNFPTSNSSNIDDSMMDTEDSQRFKRGFTC